MENSRGKLHKSLARDEVLVLEHGGIDIRVTYYRNPNRRVTIVVDAPREVSIRTEKWPTV